MKIDPQTGKVKVLRMLSAHDVGTVINPLTHQGQVEGGMVQGLGFGLMENLLNEEGRIVTANLGEYKIPSMSDVPKHETVLVQDGDGPGPFHSKPIGEHGAVPTAPCIANAIYDAIGIQIKDTTYRRGEDLPPRSRRTRMPRERNGPVLSVHRKRSPNWHCLMLRKNHGCAFDAWRNKVVPSTGNRELKQLLAETIDAPRKKHDAFDRGLTLRVACQR